MMATMDAHKAPSATHLTWIASGSPRQEGCSDTPGELCWVCAGDAGRSVLRTDWQGANYTGQNRVKYPPGTWVCEPCIFLHSRLSPVPGREAKEGKKLGGNWRNYCALVEIVDGTPFLTTATKGEKDLVRAFLRRRKIGPWFAALCESGQKHTIPGCPVNPPGTNGIVRLEETDVRVTDDLWPLVDAISEIATLGGSKEGAETGEWSSFAYARILREIEEFEERFAKPWRGSDLYKLALWLAQRDEERYAALETAWKEKLRAQQGKKGRTARGDDRPRT